MVYSYPVVDADMACNERGGEGESRTYRGNSIHNMVKHEGLMMYDLPSSILCRETETRATAIRPIAPNTRTPFAMIRQRALLEDSGEKEKRRSRKNDNGSGRG